MPTTISYIWSGCILLVFVMTLLVDHMHAFLECTPFDACSSMPALLLGLVEYELLLALYDKSIKQGLILSFLILVVIVLVIQGVICRV